jgi:hypothetical protein
LDEVEFGGALLSNFLVLRGESALSEIFGSVQAVIEHWLGKVESSSIEGVVQVAEVGIVIIVGFVVGLRVSVHGAFLFRATSKLKELESESINVNFVVSRVSVVLLGICHDALVGEGLLNVVVFAIGSWEFSTWVHTSDVLVKAGIGSVTIVVVESVELAVGVKLRFTRAVSWVFWHELAVISGWLLKSDSTLSEHIVQIAEVSVMIVVSFILSHRESVDSALMVVSVTKINKLKLEVIDPGVTSLGLVCLVAPNVLIFDLSEHIVSVTRWVVLTQGRCHDVYQTMDREIKSWGPGHPNPSGDTYYVFREVEDKDIWGYKTHESKRGDTWIDDFKFEFVDLGHGNDHECAVHGFSMTQNETHYDHDANFCNLYNVFRESGIRFETPTADDC